jgi:hypothetical protein
VTSMADRPESLPRPVEDLESLATYYATNDTSSETEHGEWADPRPMQTTSLRLPLDTVEALKALAQVRGIRYTALLRELLEDALRSAGAPEDTTLKQIDERLSKIEAAVSGQTEARNKKPAVTRKTHYSRTLSKTARQQESMARSAENQKQEPQKAAAKVRKVTTRRASTGNRLP